MIDNQISLCMIVGKKEPYIRECLSSVQNLVDEIIIVDTGCSESDVEIFQEYTEHIYKFNWNDNFSEARNFGLQFATKNWILCLDADEVFNIEHTATLKASLATNAESIISLPIINYIGDVIAEEHTYIIFQPRIFKNNQDIVFKNRIHETLHIPEKKFLHSVINTPIQHYGYLNIKSFSQKKYARNMKILQKELQDEKHSPWIEYHIASEYYRIQEYKKSIYYVNVSILRFLNIGNFPPSILYKLKYDILIKMKCFESAWPSINYAIQLYPDYVDLHYYKGLILMNLSKNQEAIKAFDTCLELGEYNPKYLILKGAGSFRAIEMKKKLEI